MSGICGIIGATNEIIRDLSSDLYYNGCEKSTSFTEDRVNIEYVDHELEFEDQPSTSDTKSTYHWCWGSVIGHNHKGNYEKIDTGVSKAEYCAKLYEEYGLSFIAGLNSEFAGVMYDPTSNTISIYTDRLGSRPIYYTYADDNSVVFSTRIQSLASHPNVNLKLSDPFLREFLTYSRTFGIYTPLDDVYMMPPASVFTFNDNGDLIDEWCYWWPKTSTSNISYHEFVEEFTTIFRDAVRDRVEGDRKQGLLLSGGSDSRLIIDLLESDSISFHMNEYFEGNREAETAKKVADEANSEFKFLQRDIDYYPNTLKNMGSISSFNGLFRHAHAIGFNEDIRTHVDELFCGQYSDTIIGGTYTPKKSLDTNLLHHLLIPSESKDIDSVDEYIQSMNAGEMGDYNEPAPYIRNLKEPENIFTSLLEERGDIVESHGVVYPSWKSLVEFGMMYPLTNAKTFINYESLNQMIPTKYPFLDNRIIDLVLKMPAKYRYQKDIVSSSLSRMNPNLSSIPHPKHRLPLSYPFYAKHYASKFTTLYDRVHKKIPKRRQSNSSLGEWVGPWPDHPNLISSNNFVEERIRYHEDMIRSLSFLDFEDLLWCYQDHLEDGDWTNQLYSVLTLLESLSQFNIEDKPL